MLSTTTNILVSQNSIIIIIVQRIKLYLNISPSVWSRLAQILTCFLLTPTTTTTKKLKIFRFKNSQFLNECSKKTLTREYLLTTYGKIYLYFCSTYLEPISYPTMMIVYSLYLSLSLCNFVFVLLKKLLRNKSVMYKLKNHN